MVLGMFEGWRHCVGRWVRKGRGKVGGRGSECICLYVRCVCVGV